MLYFNHISLKSHPELAKQFEVCPFNATHRFLGADRNAHLLECPDNNLVEQAIRKYKCEREPRCQVPVITSSASVNPTDDEDWGRVENVHAVFLTDYNPD